MLGARKFHLPKYKKFFKPAKFPPENILFLGLARSISQNVWFLCFFWKNIKKFFGVDFFYLFFSIFWAFEPGPGSP